MAVNVSSEIGRMRAVLVHAPGPELLAVTPGTREDFLYEWYEYPAVHCARKHHGVRTKRWKLIHFWQEPDEWALCDLKNDPGETDNLADDPRHADTVARLKRRIDELRAETGDSGEPEPGKPLPKLEPGKCPA